MAKIQVLQVQSEVSAEKMENISALYSILETACREKTDLVCLPEMFCCPYLASNFPKYAEEEGGPADRALSELAKAFGVYLSAGSLPERGPDGKIYNTAYVYDRQGRKIARHRKVHLFDVEIPGKLRFFESETLTPGDKATVFETEFGPMGLSICYDIRFPELARLMADAGARVILTPAAFNRVTGPAHWELLFRTRAADNQVFTLGTAPALQKDGCYQSWGHTLAADPWGQILGRLGDEPGLLRTELDLERTESVRRELPLLSGRRPEVYARAPRAL